MASAEGVGDLADAVAEDVGEPEQDRELDAAVLELVDQVLEVDGRVRVLVRVDGDVAELVDPEVALAPVADAVGLDGVVQPPGWVISESAVLRSTVLPIRTCLASVARDSDPEPGNNPRAVSSYVDSSPVQCLAAWPHCGRTESVEWLSWSHTH